MGCLYDRRSIKRLSEVYEMTRTCGIGYAAFALMLQLVTQPATGEEAPAAQYKYSDEWSVISAPPPAGPYRSVNIDPRVPGESAVIPMQVIQPLEAVVEAPEVSETQETAITASGDTSAAEAEIQQAPAAETALEAAITTADDSATVVSDIKQTPAGEPGQEAAISAADDSSDAVAEVEDTIAADELAAAVAETPQELAAEQTPETAMALPEEAMKHPPAAGIPAPSPEAVSPSRAASDAMQQYRGSRLPAPGYYGRSMRQPPAFSYPAPGRYPTQAGYPGYENVPPYNFPIYF
jgi:hypothetical protein